MGLFSCSLERSQALQTRSTGSREMAVACKMHPGASVRVRNHWRRGQPSTFLLRGLLRKFTVCLYSVVLPVSFYYLVFGKFFCASSRSSTAGGLAVARVVAGDPRRNGCCVSIETGCRTQSTQVFFGSKLLTCCSLRRHGVGVCRTVGQSR